jgi:hypothetical protein
VKKQRKNGSFLFFATIATTRLIMLRLLCTTLVVLYFVVMVNTQGITFDESKLCVSYQIGINWVDAPAGAKIMFQNPITQLAVFTIAAGSGLYIKMRFFN